MTGPRHYVAAERWLKEAEMDIQSTALAQVHATLALAAATALGTAGGMNTDDAEAWAKVAAVRFSSD